jgi:hypothetical protein
MFDFSQHMPEKRTQLAGELWDSLDSSAAPLTLELAAEPRRRREEYLPRPSSGAALAGSARRYRTAGGVTPCLLLCPAAQADLREAAEASEARDTGRGFEFCGAAADKR